MAVHLRIGVSGDYADWQTVYTYLVGLGALAHSYDLEQISDITINNNWPVGNIQLNGHQVKFYCSWGNSHQGDPTKGFITYLTGALGYFQPKNNTSVYGSIDIDGLYFVQTGNNAISLLRPTTGSGLPRPDINVVINNILIKGGSLRAAQGIVFDNSYINYHVQNVKIWNCDYGFWTTYSGTNLTNRIRLVENVTIFNSKTYGFAIGGLPEAININNCCALNSGVQDWQGGHGAGITVLMNCACGDNTIVVNLNATKTNCLANVDENVEFESIVNTNKDFLNLKKTDAFIDVNGTPRSGSVLLKIKFKSTITISGGGKLFYNGGIAPTLNFDDIAGKPYGQYGSYPIGCHNAQLNVLDVAL